MIILAASQGFARGGGAAGGSGNSSPKNGSNK
ncbi:Hypothetical protein Bdt_1632 [Bdellovibrio bacteriovorus str. Tiberius]|uniref:Uncharacterized protein n=1 Tax=Bdellovibrio bacteriovorus str. Tiberius TaxID=1069642 RepID=K7ZFA4_BDEBC|nr:Hypothetical protein Bdt_1632 [Bdellovibrio bacteriovorus str. Tiberius]